MSYKSSHNCSLSKALHLAHRTIPLNRLLEDLSQNQMVSFCIVSIEPCFPQLSSQNTQIFVEQLTFAFYIPSFFCSFPTLQDFEKVLKEQCMSNDVSYPDLSILSKEFLHPTNWYSRTALCLSLFRDRGRSILTHCIYLSWKWCCLYALFFVFTLHLTYQCRRQVTISIDLRDILILLYVVILMNLLF